MLRWPVKIALTFFGIVGIVLGIHGLYVYFQMSSWRGMLMVAAAAANSDLTAEQFFSRLFLSWGVPSPFQGWVFWASARGFEAWFVPALIIVGGIILLGLQSDIAVRRIRWPRFIQRLANKLW